MKAITEIMTVASAVCCLATMGGLVNGMFGIIGFGIRFAFFGTLTMKFAEKTLEDGKC